MKKMIVRRGNENKIIQDLTTKEKTAHTADLAERSAKTEVKEVLKKRNAERGTIAEQLEFIVENGMDAFVQREKEIRQKHLKPGQTEVNVFEKGEK